MSRPSKAAWGSLARQATCTHQRQADCHDSRDEANDELRDFRLVVGVVDVLCGDVLDASHGVPFLSSHPVGSIQLGIEIGTHHLRGWWDGGEQTDVDLMLDHGGGEVMRGHAPTPPQPALVRRRREPLASGRLVVCVRQR